MPNTPQILLDILRRQRDLYRELLDTMTRATEALRHFDVEEVDDLNKAVETLALRAKSLEESRRAATLRACVELGERAVEPSVERVAHLIGGTLGAMLTGLRHEINALIAQTASRNNQNQTVAMASLAIVHGLVRVMHGASEEMLVYGPQATVSAVGSPGRLQGRL